MQILKSNRNPLLTEALKGLGFAEVGQIHLDYLNYVLIQAAVLFLWWPKSSLSRQLETQDGPDTLLAMLIALGITMTYYSLRVGAEEILLPGQHSLREWVLATPLKLGRILRGYLAGHVLLMLHALLLSAPLLLMAYTTATGAGSALLWSLLIIMLLATFYRLLGALMYLLIGHREALIYVGLRAVLIMGYVFIGILFPIANPILNIQTTVSNTAIIDWGLPGFVLIYSVLCVVLVGLLYSVLVRQRRTT